MSQRDALFMGGLFTAFGAFMGGAAAARIWPSTSHIDDVTLGALFMFLLGVMVAGIVLLIIAGSKGDR